MSDAYETYSFEVRHTFDTETGLSVHVITLDDLHKVLSTMNKQAERLKSENNRLRKAGELMDNVCEEFDRIQKGTSGGCDIAYAVQAWRAAKEAQS